MRYILLTACLVLTAFWSTAQITSQKRIELELDDNYRNERIMTFGQDGFILRSDNTDPINNQDEWKYELYNTDLEHVKTKRVFMERRFYSSQTFVGRDRVHNLFKKKDGTYKLVSIEANDLRTTTVEGQFPRKTLVRSMTVLGDYAYFLASLKKNLFLHCINWKDGSSTIVPIEIPGYSKKMIYVERMQPLEKTGEIILFVQARKGKSGDIYVVRLNDRGEKLGQFKLTKNIDFNLTSISASVVNASKYVYSGTYASKGLSTSEGIFFCEVENDEVNFMEKHNFGKFENFFNYLPERKQKRIKKKKEKKAAKGQELKMNYLIADHPVIELDDGYLLIGEAYYPTYRTETYTTYVNGRPVMQTRTVFDGYQYTHAFVAKFNEYGDLEWDEVFEMYLSNKPFYVKRSIAIAEGEQDGLHLVYTNRDDINTKGLDFDGNQKYHRTYEIESNLEGDKSKWTNANLEYWYGQYFIAYGAQKIKNKETTDKDKRKRKVYFISKIGYE